MYFCLLSSKLILKFITKAAIRAEDMKQGISIPCRSATQAGAAQGHLTGQRRSLTITVQRRTNMNELIYTRCGDYYIPDLKLSEQPEAPLASMAVCSNAT